MRAPILVFLLAVTWSVGAASAFTLDGRAAEAKTITWDDLIPPGPELDNPFKALSVETRDDLGSVARARLDLEYGYIEEGGREHQEATALERRLIEDGHDVDALLEAAERLEAEFKRLEGQVDDSLDGQTVRMPGYALPLEFSGTGVMEFLLVPFVGACIHVPPPPPNQMVYVALNQSYKVKSLYDPVWITGVMRVKQSTKALSYVDGEAEVAAGYTLEAIAIEPYR